MRLSRPNKTFARRAQVNECPNWRVNQRPVIKAAPMSNWAINRVSQGMKTLKFFNIKKEVVLFSDSEQKAGMNDDDEEDDDSQVKEEDKNSQ